MASQLFVYGDGTQTRDYVYSGDLVDGIRSAIEKKQSGVFQLGTGRPTSLNQLVSVLKEVVGTAYPVDVEFENFRVGEVLHSYCDITKARAELGYDPKTKLRDGCLETWRWLSENWESNSATN